MSCGPNQPKRIEVVNVPGVAGSTGAAGTNGQNAYTATTADFQLPAVNGSVNVLVVSSLWMATGQPLFISDGTNQANFTVQSFPNSASVTVVFNGYSGDAAPGTTIAAGAAVSPTGQQGPAVATPLPIASGGTNSTTVPNAQTALGLGRNAVISSGSALAQTITNSSVQVGAVSITIPNAGQYLYFANAVVTWSGVTFASSRNITFTVRNITQGITLTTATFATGTATTATFPSSVFALPFALDASANSADVVQLLVSIDTVNSAGTLAVAAGSLCAVPLRYVL